MRILCVGMPTSHLARWVASLTGLGWDVHVYPVFFRNIPTTPHELLAGITYWDTAGLEASHPEREFRVQSPDAAHRRVLRSLNGRRTRGPQSLANVIRRIRPDIVHSFEFQHAGYLTLEARDRLGANEMPYWIQTNYGNDISLFGQLLSHRLRIAHLMQAVDLHVAECERDLELGIRFGYTGPRQEVIPMGGGWDLVALEALRTPGPTSVRRTIAVKSYDGWQGRASFALDAIRRAADVLAEYTIVLYLSNDQFFERATRLGRKFGLSIEHVGGPRRGLVPYEQMLMLHGRSRISIGVSISDGIAISTLEAMVMGSMPLQTNTGCQNEWLTSGVNGLLVPPEDPQVVADAIRLAVTDDALVDEAAVINARISRERLAYPVVQRQIVAMYEEAYARAREIRSRPGATRRSG